MVLKLNLGLVGIHHWCQFGDSTSKVKEIRDVIRFVKERFVTDGQTERQKDRWTMSISIVPRRGDGGQKVVELEIIGACNLKAN